MVTHESGVRGSQAYFRLGSDGKRPQYKVINESGYKRVENSPSIYRPEDFRRFASAHRPTKSTDSTATASTKKWDASLVAVPFRR